MPKIKKEELLYNPVRNFLVARGFVVQGEVLHCDVCALKEEVLVVVELKKTLNFELILQGTERQRTADLVYIAIPKDSHPILKKRRKEVLHLLKRLELGLMVVDCDKDHVDVVLEPFPFERSASIRGQKKKRQKMIQELMERKVEYNLGGSTRKKIMTAYRENALQIAYLLSEHGECSPKQLRDLGIGTKCASILQDNYYGWFERISRGIYRLSEVGKQALCEYKEVVNMLHRETLAEE